MDKIYADTVRLLLRTAPEVFSGKIFAMKGGTAINLFLQNMPRLSVDIDAVYLPHRTPREAALVEIAEELSRVAKQQEPLGVRTRLVRSGDLGELKLLVDDGNSQVKIEVNGVFRGSVRPIEFRKLDPAVSEMFAMEFSLPILAPEELYGSKLVAALDRQHPRDLFDVHQLLASNGLSDAVVECFVTYLAAHNRPVHEMLFGNDKDISVEFERNFEGMTAEPVSLETLLRTRSRLRVELPALLTAQQRQFLIGLGWSRPDWGLLACSHAAELPALRWKLINLEKFSRSRPEDFARQARELERLLS